MSGILMCCAVNLGLDGQSGSLSMAVLGTPLKPKVFGNRWGHSSDSLLPHSALSSVSCCQYVLYS
eukprot:4984916-Amphidinium_carterae.1